MRVRRLKTLPRRGTWEVGLLPFPQVTIAEVDLEGMLFVVESRTGLVRGAVPVQRGDDIGEHLVSTTREAPSAPDGRPKTIQCNPEIFGRLEPAAKQLGARLVASEVLPAVEHVAVTLSGHLAPELPLLPVHNPEAWVPVIAELARERPWRVLDDQIWFQLSGPEDLDGWVAIVLGKAGEQRGLSFHPDLESLHEFVSGKAEVHEDFWSYCVHLDPREAVDPKQLAWAEAHDLVFGPWVLVPFQVSSDGLEPLSHDDDTLWLAGTQAVLAAWLEHGAALLTEPTLTTAETVRGTVEVRSAHADDLEPAPLVEAPHQMMFEIGDGVRRLCFKAAKRDAERIAAQLEQVDAVLVAPEWDSVTLSARLHDGSTVPIATLPPTAELWAEFNGEACLVAIKGGAKRRGYRASDVLLERTVPIEGPRVQTPMRHDWRDSADYSGPAETWPLASTVLLAFGEPLELTSMPPAPFEAAVRFLMTVWNAVVLADAVGEDRGLAEVFQLLAGDAVEVGEALIARKRAKFADDTRIMMVHEITWTAGQANVTVQWRDVCNTS